ncbi:Uncharacterised protein [Alloiococcus otitis]|uniref:Lipoprotein n=1 Tax=Alloiococcus otitis ATCC 51267 TaxID=883081 RepID=K9EV71_9LACT|nr:hypothetical protein [Alloiococcus otitis]EKU93115.1 hypothetical protein HMPREF9698_01192 [Alloiococcus otitis ATCC 51267]SUU80749.1 Uncharacterised protein [Alloiococcus otitis]
MKKWTKLLSIPVAVTLLAACGDNTAQEDPAEDPTVEETAPEEEAGTDQTAEDDMNEDDTTEDDTAEDDTAEDDTAEDDTEDDTADAESGASVIQTADEAQDAMSADGEWIVVLEQDLQVDEDLTLEAQDNEEGERKLAFYDDEGDETQLYTLTVPSLTIEAENTRFAGRVEGDVIVDADGFSFENDPEIDGDLIFTSQEFHDSADFDEASVTGEVIIEDGEETEDQAQ